jgi:hypothetical protein
MERESAEKAGVAGLMSGVQEMAIRREAENFAKRGCSTKKKERSKPAISKIRGLRRPSRQNFLAAYR